ncbi:PPE domain-containing protein [Pseudonocardia asaccharolytica]|uniref:Uncharacterized protein n=1 Tax=Pseudonocardia asaccharolytica DSM 44247 = NBRC 16224 TaxID=1123024 RepID=A0A511D0U9_9PSEU|nr:PPE domain-containing protein [Pseudonocardia asaccharolytica]GEL18396.1 hypothetical protein PA7_22330 [Pseudonocardia asaccharolytica DSM 44247 = NBRC 16224]
MTNPLIAAPENEDAEPANWEGAGVFSSVADLTAGLTGGDAQLAAFSAAGAGLDALGLVMNPLGSLLEAGIGWLIEHVAFLHEPLDALAGDPTQIRAQARTWHNVAGELRSVVGRYRDEAGALPGWEGAAADAYRAAARCYTTALRNMGAQADELAVLILGTGELVGTVRALVRDVVASFVADLIMVGIGAVVAAVASAGTTLAAAVAWAVNRACQVAAMIADRIGSLLDDLTGLAGSLGRTCGRLDDVSDAVARGVERIGAGATGSGALRRPAPGENPLGMSPAVAGAAEELGRLPGAKVVVERGKEDAKADAELRGWQASRPADDDLFGRYPSG